MSEPTNDMAQVLQEAREALQGERVRLRALREDDLPHLVHWWRDPEVAVFNDAVRPRPDGPLEEQFRAWSLNGPGSDTALCIETLGGQLVGHVALFGITGRNRCGTFGIMIGLGHQSKGYGTEATRLMVSYGFRELGLHRIELTVNAENVRAIEAYRKAGFEQEGVLRQKLFYGGRFHDQVLMAQLSPAT